MVAAVCSLTFDSMSFPVFALTYPVLVGLSGSVWLMAKSENAVVPPSELAISRPVPNVGSGRTLKGEGPWTR